MRTSTPIETTRIGLEAADGGLRVRAAGGVIRVMTLRRGPRSARVALVPDRALLLAGDRIRVEVSVGPGVDLEIVETAGTVAYDMRGDRAGWAVEVRVGRGGRCRWHGLPFVVSDGADVSRDLSVDLAGDAAFTQRETLVLGRFGEAAGRLRSTTRVHREGRPVLIEELCGGHLAPYRVLDSVLSLTAEDSAETPEVTPPAAVRLDLAEGGRCWRSLSQEAHRSAAVLDPVWAALAG